MKKIYYLSTCSTCKKIIQDLNLGNDFEFQDIKTTKITDVQLQEMVKLSSSYESLFSRRAIKYKTMGLKDKQLTEKDYKSLILKEYTFLKRPVILINDAIFVGNSAKTVDAAKKLL